MTDAERARLLGWAHGESARLAVRAKIVLACAAGAPGAAVARRFETTNATVGKWRGRFIER
ncbi:MAG: helix-turn-helix domain-containing protein, partial [Thermoleophilia bacterium]